MLVSAQALSGRRAPSFALPDSALKQYDILDFRGRWLILEFIRTSYAPSKPVTIQLERVKARLGAKATILAIATPPDNTATAAKYIAETKSTIPILFDSGQTAMWYFKASPQHPQIDAPHVFAINPQGMIVRDWSEGQTNASGFTAELERVVNGAPAAK